MQNRLFIKDIVIDWNKIDEDSYLRSIDAINGVDRITFNKSVTFFVGENGSGKSTLLDAMASAEGYGSEGGTKNYSFSTYDSQSELSNAICLSRQIKAGWGYYLRADSFYNVATMEEEYSKGPGGTSMHLHEMSHGEGFLAVFQNSMNGPGLFFLDEPESALSAQRQLTLLYEIDRCVKQGAQFFIATHSPILLGFPDADILSFDGGRIHSCSYEDTGSYIITSMFINDRDLVLSKLIKE